MMLPAGFSIPTILSMVVLLIVSVVAVYKTIALKRQTDQMRADGPKSDAAQVLIGTAFKSMEAVGLLTAAFIMILVTIGSYVFSMMRNRQISYLKMYWIAMFSPIVMVVTYLLAATVSAKIVAKVMGNINNSLPPQAVVEKASGAAPAPAGVEGYSPFGSYPFSTIVPNSINLF